MANVNYCSYDRNADVFAQHLLANKELDGQRPSVDHSHEHLSSPTNAS